MYSITGYHIGLWFNRYIMSFRIALRDVYIKWMLLSPMGDGCIRLNYTCFEGYVMKNITYMVLLHLGHLTPVLFSRVLCLLKHLMYPSPVHVPESEVYAICELV